MRYATDSTCCRVLWTGQTFLKVHFPSTLDLELLNQKNQKYGLIFSRHITTRLLSFKLMTN